MRGLRKLFRNRYNRRYINNDSTDNTAKRNENNQAADIIAPDITQDSSCAANIFILNMYKYIGETVTVFVNSGGISGLGFTGVLLKVYNTYIELITVIGPAPDYAFCNNCTYETDCRFAALKNNYVKTLGAVIFIPVDKIVSFVHNLM